MDLDYSNRPMIGKTFVIIIWLAFALSGWVVIEPAPVDILILIAFSMAIFSSYLTFRVHLILPLILIWLFILQNILSMYFMDNPLTGFYYFLVTLYLVIFWALIIGLISSFEEKITPIIICGYVTAGLLSALIGITAYFNIIPYSETFMYLGRIKGLFKDPNVFGPFLIPVALFSIPFFEAASTKKIKLYWLLIFVLLSTAIFLCFSRGAWINYCISFSCFFIIWVLLSPNKTSRVNRSYYLVVLLFIFISVMVLLLNNTSIQSMFDTRFRIQHYDNNRFSTQFIVLDVIKDFPLGKGPGQYDCITNYSAHSLYVRVLGENGVLGFISFIIFLVLTWIRSCYASFKTKSTLYIICTASLLGLFVNSIVIDTLHWRHFWILLAIPWVYQKKG